MNKKKWKLKIGITLISISMAFFLIIFALPFISMDLKIKIVLTSVLVIVGEVSFWVGTILIGKDIYLKFKEKLKSGECLEKRNEDNNDRIN